MELVTLECDLTAKPLESPKSLISINFRRFRQTVHRKSNGEETIKKLKLLSSLLKIEHEIRSVRDIGSLLDKSMLNINSWVQKRVLALISSKAATCMTDDHQAYLIEADVDVILEKRYNENVSLEVVEEKTKKMKKTCAICLDDLPGGVGCTEIPCSHMFHRDCIWLWLRKSKSCPVCRLCVCGQDSCRCIS